ncbi:MAG: hypothetical protein A2X97_15210 [Bdellovibrionales bacterium GWA1_52_35]|nr:MAG: hypothetical protein A2X97_15210 [Bdellovibrionales bacterium GWA1_52_35]HCM40486.1 hypothetical protein [Bdellovibrionales bacterium]
MRSKVLLVFALLGTTSCALYFSENNPYSRVSLLAESTAKTVLSLFEAINVPLTALGFSPGTHSFPVNTTITPLVSTHTGGAIFACSGTLPQGLSVEEASGECQISGTPKVVDSGTYTITARNDANSVTTTVNIDITQSDLSNLSFSPSSFTFCSGLLIDTFTSSHTGGTIASCSSDPALPAVISINATNGECQLSGTAPVGSSSANYTITGSNSTGSSVSTDVSIAINTTCQPTRISFPQTSYTFPTGTQIIAIVAGNVGSAATGCSVFPALPMGLTLALGTGADSDKCVLSGTPTEIKPATDYNITVSNDMGSGSTTVNIEVYGPPTNLAFVGAPYTFTEGMAITSISSTHLGGPITSCSDTLPAGLNVQLVSGECQISGTPNTATATGNYTITATGAAGSTTATVSITVKAAAATNLPPSNLNFIESTMILCIRNNMDILTSTHSGGSITSCSSSPALPLDPLNGATTPLVAVNGECQISGNPGSASSATNYTITASNSFGSATRVLNIAVSSLCQPMAINFVGTPFTFIKDVPISQKISTNNGGIATSCTATPPLPTGLIVEAINQGSIKGDCVISGTPTVTQIATDHVIKATNAQGSGYGKINITVVP